MKRAVALVLTLLVCISPVSGQPVHAASTVWQPVSGPSGGSVSALTISPNYTADHTAFAGVRGRGVYRTVDNGESWQLTSPADWNIIDVAASPAYAADRTVFAAFGFWSSSYSVYRSTDEGATWQAPTSPPYSYGFNSITSLSVSPDFANDRTLYVLGSTETYRSTDGGDTFVIASGWFASHQVTHLEFSPAYASDRMLFAAAWSDRLYKSTDGSTWNPTPLVGDVSALAVSSDFTYDHTLAAILDDGTLHLSTDGGTTWITGTLTLGAGGKHTLIVRDQIMFAASSADGGAYRSTDGGATWSPVGWYNPAQSYLGGFIGGGVYDIVVAPSPSYAPYAFAGTSSGIYRSLNEGESWSQHNVGMPRLTVRSLAAVPNDPSTLLAGTNFFETVNSYAPIEIDGSLQLTNDGGRTWRDVTGRIGRVQRVAVSPDFANDMTALAAAGFSGQHGYSNGGLYRSIDGGQNWLQVKTGLWYGLAISPDFAKDQTAWAYGSSTSGPGLYVSSDGGGTWTLLTSSIPAQLIAPSPNFAIDRTIFAGTSSGGLQRSTNAGLNWTQVLAQPVTALAVSPAYGASRTVYAGAQVGSAPGEMYRSTDAGATWQKLSTGIPPLSGALSLNITTLNFAADGSVLAGVTYGYPGSGAAYRSTDGGQTWQSIASGLNASNLFDLTSASNRIDPISSSDPTERGLYGALSIFAGTDSGLWEFDAAQSDPGESGVWSSGGPRGGKAQALAVSPNFAIDGVAFSGEWLMGHAGGESGLGIFKSTDGGQTWSASGSGAQSPPLAYSTSVHGYAVSPGFATDKTAFAATWGGLFKSTDGGTTWKWLTRAALSLPGSFTAVAVSPNYASSGHVLAANGWGGVSISRNGGATWTSYVSVTTPSAIAYSPNFASDDTAFAAGFGVYKTIDGGTGWTQVLSDSVSALAVSPQFGSDQTLFAGGDWLFQSTNSGAAWITSTVALTPTRINTLAISPVFATDHVLFAGTNAGLYRSDNSGGVWNKVPGFPNVAVLSLAISPGWPAHPVLLAGTARGVYRSADGGATWTLTQGMVALSALPVTLSPDGALLLTGASNHGVYASADGGSIWLPIGLQDGSFYYSILDAAISPAYATDQTMFAAWKSDVSIGGSAYRTTDGGAAWQHVYNTDSVPSLAISPGYAGDHTIFAVGNTNRVMESTDGGDHWSPVGTWPPGTLYPAYQVALPPNYPTDRTLFAGGYSGFWRLPPLASTWVPAASGLLSDTNVIAFAVSPNYTTSQTLLAIAWRSTITRLHYAAFRSTDGGVNWQPSGIGLPDAELRGVAFSPNFATDHTAYIATLNRLYRSIDGGQHWTAMGSPPGRPPLNRIAVNRAGQVYVTTSAGVWRYATGFRDLIADGGFESGSGWAMPTTVAPAYYAGNVIYNGRGSMHIGIDNGTNALAYSSARQTVTVPISATTAQLSFRMLPVSGEAQVAAQGRVRSADRAAAGDAQYVLVLDPDSGSILQTLLWTLSNAQAWQSHTFDLSPYAGQAIVLHFGVYNDGSGGRTALYLDGASLIVLGWLPNKVYLPTMLKNAQP